MARPGRHAEGAQTRERVLEAAAELIGRQGYAATSIAQISRASGAKPASIYWAFGNKEGLLAAVMERAADRFFEALPEAGFEADPWTALAALSTAFEGGPEFLRLMLVLSLERRDGDPAVLEAARRVRMTATEALAAGYRAVFATRGTAREVEIAEELARFTLMLFDGAFIASRIEPETTNLKRTFALIATSVRATGERLLANSRDE
ncbi:MAG: TetR/AcrR family transcriptional regulator [Myxococcota bacterium]